MLNTLMRVKPQRICLIEEARWGCFGRIGAAVSFLTLQRWEMDESLQVRHRILQHADTVGFLHHDVNKLAVNGVMFLPQWQKGVFVGGG